MYLATHVNETNLDDKRFWDVYAKAEELGWTIFLHPIDTLARERTARTTCAICSAIPTIPASLQPRCIFGGVLDDFPKLGDEPAARGRHVPVAHRSP